MSDQIDNKTKEDISSSIHASLSGVSITSTSDDRADSKSEPPIAGGTHDDDKTDQHSIEQQPIDESIASVNMTPFPGSFPSDSNEADADSEISVSELDQGQDKGIEEEHRQTRPLASSSSSISSRFLSPERIRKTLTHNRLSLSPSRIISTFPKKSKDLLRFNSSSHHLHHRSSSTDSVDSDKSDRGSKSSISRLHESKSTEFNPSAFSQEWLTRDGTSIDGIAKSFVGLLTTTSMYAGYEDMDDGLNIDDNSDSDDESHRSTHSKLEHPMDYERGESTDLESDSELEDEDLEDIDDELQKLEAEDIDQSNRSVDSLDEKDNQTLRLGSGDGIYNLSNDTSVTVKDPHSSSHVSGQNIGTASTVIPIPAATTTTTSDTLKINKQSPALKATSLAGAPIMRRKSTFELSVERTFSKSGSNASLKRASALYRKLVKIFDIPHDDELVGDYSCWLMGDVLLQGHLYITAQCILFFAFLPKKQGNIIKSGTMSTKSYPSLREHRKWAILRDNSLTIYSSATDLYFPQCVIDLRTAIRAETIYDRNSSSSNPNKPVWIRIITETTTHSYLLDSLDAARGWVAALKKQIFAAKAVDDQVAVKIPLVNVMDLELTSVVGEAKNLRIKVLEDSDSFAVDDYFLMFFVKGDEAIANIRQSLDKAGIDLSTSSLLLEGSNNKEGNKTSNEGTSQQLRSKLSKVSVYKPSLDKLKSRVLASHSYLTSHVYRKRSNAEDNEYTEQDNEEPLIEITVRSDSVESSASEISIPNMDEASKEPPSSQEMSLQQTSESSKHSSYWGSNIVKSLVNTTSAVGSSLFPANHYISHYDEKNSLERGDEDSYFVKSDQDRKSATDKFQRLFSLPSTEKLIATYNAYLLKSFPIYGKIYLGSNEICFKSTTPGVSTTMILPFTDVENIYKEKGFRFGYSGLVIVIHGHEESFFEFSFRETRDDCEVLLLKQIDIYKKSSLDMSVNIQTSESSSGDETNYKLAESNTSLSNARINFFESRLTDHIGTDVPIILKDSSFSKTVIKPAKSFKITLLTIGSRGDVQPYIALGKALLKEGQQVKIVSHKEFGDWVKSHGIEFESIAGEPSELMNLMVSHPNFNYSFIKEARKKFKTWIDDLLSTAWVACADSELIIESPSTMCGIHIAEKLQIPYFRAFTMPWTRTRAYPHAFMVPDQKLGGAYNYMTHVAFENAFWKGISNQVNKWRVETLGLPKTNLSLMKQSSVPFLYNISPTVFPPSVDFSEWIKVTGYWFLDETNTFEPPKELTDFMEKARKDDKKLVYIGFGSIVVTNPAELTQAIVDAVLEADVRCILNKGWSDRLGGDKSVIETVLPPEVYNAGTVPHDWLFPQIDAAVHHGGSGTTGASLRFGLPTIVKPFFGDQKFYAGRVEDLGVGVALKDLNYKSMAKALKKVTTNGRIIEKARLIGIKIRSENGVQSAIEAIYSELEYARKLAATKAYNSQQVDSNKVSDDEMDDSWLVI